jgi:hypothetical protein
MVQLHKLWSLSTGVLTLLDLRYRAARYIEGKKILKLSKVVENEILAIIWF